MRILFVSLDVLHLQNNSSGIRIQWGGTIDFNAKPIIEIHFLQPQIYV